MTVDGWGITREDGSLCGKFFFTHCAAWMASQEIPGSRPIPVLLTKAPNKDETKQALRLVRGGRDDQ